MYLTNQLHLCSFCNNYCVYVNYYCLCKQLALACILQVSNQLIVTLMYLTNQLHYPLGICVSTVWRRVIERKHRPASGSAVKLEEIPRLLFT